MTLALSTLVCLEICFWQYTFGSVKYGPDIEVCTLPPGCIHWFSGGNRFSRLYIMLFLFPCDFESQGYTTLAEILYTYTKQYFHSLLMTIMLVYLSDLYIYIRFPSFFFFACAGSIYIYIYIYIYLWTSHPVTQYLFYNKYIL